jgi:hypothetical protein
MRPHRSSRSSNSDLLRALAAAPDIDTLDAHTADKVLSLEKNDQGLVKLTPEALALQNQIEESRLRSQG